MLTDDLLASELKTMAETPAPPLRLDIDLARTKGRRVRRHRSAAIAAVCAVAIAATAAVAIPAALRDDASQDNRPADIVPPQRDALLVSRATFGWLPEDTAGIGVTDDDHHGVYTQARAPGDGGPYATVAVHPANETPPDPSGPDRIRPLYLVPAEPVNGQQAYWATENKEDPLNRGSLRLIWQVPSGEWADLTAGSLNSADVRRVAADITVKNTPVAIPIRIDGLPAEFDNADVDLSRPAWMGPGPWQLGVHYWIDGALVEILVAPQGTFQFVPPAGWTAACEAEGELYMCVVHGHAASPLLDSMGGPQGVLDLVTPLGMDESKWTTDPIQ